MHAFRIKSGFLTEISHDISVSRGLGIEHLGPNSLYGDPVEGIKQTARRDTVPGISDAI